MYIFTGCGYWPFEGKKSDMSMTRTCYDHISKPKAPRGRDTQYRLPNDSMDIPLSLPQRDGWQKPI